jgi:predicted flap endonuclease-1-like 5' DNA nuclease
MTKTKQELIKELQTLPNIGKITAHKLYTLGITTPQDMKHANPDALDVFYINLEEQN